MVNKPRKRGGRRHRRSKISDLPHDLLRLILIRLPVKSLLRFRCVSKSWNLLISGQDFVKMHLNQSLAHPKPLGLIWKNDLFCKKGLFQRTHIFAVDCSKLESSSDDTIHRLHHPLELEVPNTKESKLIDPESTLIGSCNGLLCLTWFRYNGSAYEDSFLVFNPLTRKCLNFSGETISHDNEDARSYYYGFGYDDAHDDYKVVTWGVRSEQSEDDPDCSKFDVYSVKKGSWRTIISGLTGFGCYINGISCGVLVNCVLHWMWANSDDKYNIVAFDLKTEKHRLMETPENDLAIPQFDDEDEDEAHSCRMELGALNGCLCGIVFHRKDVQYKLDLWIMKEYGLKNSWTKMTIDVSFYQHYARGLYKLDKVTPIVPVLHVENKKQLILFSYQQGFLVCDMVTNKLSKVIKLSEFDPKSHEKVRTIRSFLPKEFSFKRSLVPKEFCFQGSLVQPPGFDSFHSLWDEHVAAKQIRQQS